MDAKAEVIDNMDSGKEKLLKIAKSAIKGVIVVAVVAVAVVGVAALVSWKHGRIENAEAVVQEVLEQ